MDTIRFRCWRPFSRPPSPHSPDRLLIRLSILLPGLLLLPAVSARPQPTDSAKYSAPAPGEPLCTLDIHVEGFRNDIGDAGGAVYASPAGWPEDTAKSIVHGGFPIQGDQSTETFKIPPGRYGVVVIHDENSNEKLDRNIFGVPKEGFGFANNPKIELSAPSFQTASVTVGCPVTRIAIRLIYK